MGAIAGKSLHEPQAQIASCVLSSAPTLCVRQSRAPAASSLEQRASKMRRFCVTGCWQSDFPPRCMRGWANYFWQLSSCVLFLLFGFFRDSWGARLRLLIVFCCCLRKKLRGELTFGGVIQFVQKAPLIISCFLNQFSSSWIVSVLIILL